MALRQLHLDYVWWLVTPGNPLKRASELADLLTRTADARALARHPRIIVTDIETGLGTRYTADTLAALARRFPALRFTWVMGSDNLEQFGQWKNWPAIVKRVPLVVVRRPGSALAAIRSIAVRRFGTVSRLGPPPAILLLDGRRNWQSSTGLRALRLEPRAPSC